MTTKWSSYRGVPLLGHLHVADQQQKKKSSDWSQPLKKQYFPHNQKSEYILNTFGSELNYRKVK